MPRQGSTEVTDVPAGGAWVPGSVIGGYVIRSVLGHGGMGRVYAAERLTTRQLVALKAPLSGSNARVNARLLREARHAMSVNHPNVARVLDADVDATGVPFIVMEHLDGESLAERLTRQGPIAWGNAAAHIEQSCRGLEAIHATGLIHRDIKPSNLFVVRAADGAETTKVIDLGLSKRVDDDESLTASGVGFIGSVAYVAPELLRARAEANARSDIWSLGVTLFELITGKLPFEGATPSALVAAIVHQPPQHVSTYVEGLPTELVHLIDDSMRPAPEKRPPTVEQFRRRLLSCVGGPSLVATVFASGPSFVCHLIDRTLILIWLRMPSISDLEVGVRTFGKARRIAGRRLTYLVVMPEDVHLGSLDLATVSEMRRRMPEAIIHFERMFMLIEGDSFLAGIIKHFSEILAANIEIPWKIGDRGPILEEISRREGIPLEVLGRALARR